MSSIQLYAGPTALKQLREQGVRADQFDAMVGASGGPKWFTLFGLDCYLFGEFFANRETPIHTLGSSAGSWRMACFAQDDPVGAIQRLAHYYSRETYSRKPDRHEISDKAMQMLDKVFGTTGEAEIANSRVVQSHFIVARAKGLNQFDHPLLQMAGLLTAAGANALSRRRLAGHFERILFYTRNEQFTAPYFQFNDLPTQYVEANQQNLHAALMASGAIPMVLRGVSDIPSAPQGVYRDGGIIDYHLDLDFRTQQLVLYPHFFPSLKPGWFDKGLKSRKANPAHFDKVLLITPSHQHVAHLPYAKISDRNDFKTMDDTTRISYWQAILDRSHDMAEDFRRLVDTGEGIEQIQPIASILA